jgi:hypothetical protein
LRFTEASVTKLGGARLSFHFVIIMVGKILQPEIRSLIDARNFTALRELFSDVTGLIIYFSIALLIMRGAML